MHFHIGYASSGVYWGSAPPSGAGMALLSPRYMNTLNDMPSPVTVSADNTQPHEPFSGQSLMLHLVWKTECSLHHTIIYFLICHKIHFMEHLYSPWGRTTGPTIR